MIDNSAKLLANTLVELAGETHQLRFQLENEKDGRDFREKQLNKIIKDLQTEITIARQHIAKNQNTYVERETRDASEIQRLNNVIEVNERIYNEKTATLIQEKNDQLNKIITLEKEYEAFLDAMDTIHDNVRGDLTKLIFKMKKQNVTQGYIVRKLKQIFNNVPDPNDAR